MHDLWFHVHVPKAGGSTLRQLMNRNFGKGYYNSVSLLESKQYTRQDVYEIAKSQPWLRCMSDHKLSLDLPYDFLRQPFTPTPLSVNQSIAIFLGTFIIGTPTSNARPKRPRI
jgi:hypothetical protein